MEKREELYAGKAKSVYVTDDPERLILWFRDDTSAFDGKKHTVLSGKGAFNNRFNAFIMEHLAAQGVATHFDRLLGPEEALVRRLDMIPVECVVRNRAAGSLCKRLGVEQGLMLKQPLFEFFLKNDELGDPLINEGHILAFGWADEDSILAMKQQSFRVNELLCPLFDEAGIELVDYKLEFGLSHGQLMLGDEFTPDGCRLWDKKTGHKMDKDRFREDLGDVLESYQQAGRRLKMEI